MPHRELRWRPGLPDGTPRERAAPVADDDWERHRSQITKWHQLDLSRKEIQKLLREDGLDVKKDPLWRKMTSWNLTRTTKGKGAETVECVAVKADYGVQCDNTVDSGLMDDPPVFAPEAESSHGSIALHSLQRQHDPSAFKVGTVFAEVGGLDPRLNKERIKIWLVVALRAASDVVDCIRIKSFAGRGIEGSLAAYYPSGNGADVDDEGFKQRHINAHAMVHTQGPHEIEQPPGLATSKLPLEVKVDPDLSPTILPRMSCALFTGHRSLSCRSNFALIGSLTTFSVALVEIYYKQLCEGSSDIGSPIEGEMESGES